MKDGLICFSLTSSSQPLSFGNIILCKLEQVPRHRFVKQRNTHMSTSVVPYINILTSSIKFSETVTMSIKQISNSHVLASIIYQDRCPIVQVGDHTFFLIRTSHNFIHHKSMKHLKDCTSIFDIVHLLNGVFHRISKTCL